MTNSMIRRVWTLMGIMLISFLLFAFVFGTPGRSFMWGAFERVMQLTWQSDTYDDGRILSSNLDANFNTLQEVVE